VRRARPAPGETGHLSRWLDAVENMGPLAAAGLGFGVYAANPKNLTVGLSAGVAFGSADLPLGAAVLVGGVYLLIAASTVIVSVAAYFIAQERVRPWLDELRQWLAAHNAALMAVLLLVIGALMLGKGVAALDTL
jgi:threonine/homoserine/homoserine lactone efflux protein